jgi:SWI/SNF-related matrix-associated actin-dependent regulator of chromatin subfamily A member 5
VAWDELNQKRKTDENELHKKCEEMDKTKVTSTSLAMKYRDSSLLLQLADAVKRYSYLLGQTELFKYFVDVIFDEQ